MLSNYYGDDKYKPRTSNKLIMKGPNYDLSGYYNSIVDSIENTGETVDYPFNLSGLDSVTKVVLSKCNYSGVPTILGTAFYKGSTLAGKIGKDGYGDDGKQYCDPNTDPYYYTYEVASNLTIVGMNISVGRVGDYYLGGIQFIADYNDDIYE